MKWLLSTKVVSVVNLQNERPLTLHRLYKVNNLSFFIINYSSRSYLLLLLFTMSSVQLTSLPLISELNILPDHEFLTVVNTLFETAPPLAQRLLARRPYTSYEQLISTAEDIILPASSSTSSASSPLNDEEILQVVNAHPRIGAPVASLSALSQREQSGGHALNTNTNAETEAVALAKTLEQLAELNAAYEAKYGFRFIVFVNGRSRAEIVPILKDRLDHGERDKEIRIALEAMLAIARDRLTKIQHAKL
jgi:2-oxo-4-hydroxy-4-carboxy-5-ureidoimidazoline decarboxylase